MGNSEISTMSPHLDGVDANDDNIHIEDLMYKYKSDKSREDHGYTKLYHMIFSPIRMSVRNITEIGIAAGQSLQAWYRYFPNADIHGFDISLDERVKENIDMLSPRVKAHITNILDENKVPNLAELGFLNETMDIIIDDGPHSLSTQESFLAKLFHILKPGGFYVIEDIGFAGKQAMKQFHENPDQLNEATRQILESNDAIWVDSTIGHRAWDRWVRMVGKKWAANHTHHNSYCIVIQKRVKPLRKEVQMNYGNGAMTVDGVLKENNTGH